MRFPLPLLLALALPGLGATTKSSAPAPAPAPKPATPAPAAKPATAGKAFDVTALDPTVKPCDNFYQYVCGGWFKANPIPDDQPAWGRWNEVIERNRSILKTVLEQAAADKTAKPGSSIRKIGDYYSACMDEKQADLGGAKPLAEDLAKIAAIKDLAGLTQVVSGLQDRGTGVLFGFGSTQDAKDSASVIGGLDQGGLGLPDRDYYLTDKPESKTLREKYVAHMTKIFTLLGDAPAAASANAATVMEIETELARNSMDKVDRRDPDKTYHKMDLASLQKITPNFVWADYFKAQGAPEFKAVDVSYPEFFRAVSVLLRWVPIKDWQTYLRWHLAHSQASRLSSAFINENFDFYSRTLTGAKTLQPRWKRCVSASDRDLREMLGQAYVDAAFPPAAKARMLEMVNNLTAALDSDIKTLDWMDAPTQVKAAEKLHAFNKKIGYPDRWINYDTLQISRASWAQNHAGAAHFENLRDLSKIGKPVDRLEWGMTPSTVNAYYSAEMNEIVFPAGILQPPFFDPKSDDAMNYGAIGMVIGHEMTHGFDDEGRKFDAQGNLKDWWTEPSAKNYEARSACVVKQFNGYEPIPGSHVNGELTLGENTADLGGLKIAFAALRMKEGATPAAPIDGFTWQQRFFLGMGQAWCQNQRPELLKLQVNTDPHSPDEYRVNGPLANLPEFREAFACPADAKMLRKGDDICKIW
jgi:predicted metalloendopeptidase